MSSPIAWRGTTWKPVYRRADVQPVPVPMRWRCQSCGHTWETVTAILPRARGCPECGGRARVVEEGET